MNEQTNNLTVERGGVKFSLYKIADRFVVKKRNGRSRGQLRYVGNTPTISIPLNQPIASNVVKFDNASSPAERFRLEVFSVAPDQRDIAMNAVRQFETDVEWCAHLYSPSEHPDDLLIPSDSIFAIFDSSVSDQQINTLLVKHGLELMPMPEDNTRQGDRAFLLRLTRQSAQNPIKIANALLQIAGVKVAEPDFFANTELFIYRPSDPLFPLQWHLENQGGPGLTPGADINAPAAWDITRGVRDITVCVIDDAIDVYHPDFSGQNKLNTPYDFQDQGTNPSPELDSENHGTACAGIAVAEENGQGGVGVAPGCRLMPVRMTSWISDQTVKTMFEHVRLMGADVISCSWGSSNEYYPLSTNAKNAISRAAKEGRGGKGCVICFAAGNDAVPVQGMMNGKNYLNGFAVHPDVICVAATNSHDQPSEYNNFGAEVWVAAPSSGAGGRRVLTTDRLAGKGYETGDYTSSYGFGGTSAATPAIAGICALMLSINPNLTANQVKEILRQTAEKVSPDKAKYDASGHSNWVGYGRANAFRAVQMAQALKNSAIQVQPFKLSVSPNLAIPDASTAGVSNTIVCNRSGKVQNLAINVEITHPQRGDLIVRLISPDKVEVTLHHQSGGSQQNLKSTFTPTTTPALQQLLGRSAGGNWQLVVADSFLEDRGTWKNWGLELDILPDTNDTPNSSPATPPASNLFGARVNKPIPDADLNGIKSAVNVSQTGVVAEIEVFVDITHPYRGDLLVALDSPSGQRVLLHTGAGGNLDDLKVLYNLANRPQLASLVGKPMQGIWNLWVVDRKAGDVGTFNAWALRFK
ncbi:MAG TPA: S8 family serine peptidase [Anaerolineales bacterium]|nr:S8 family serine peptidase [Anaerolineales bacterium]